MLLSIVLAATAVASGWLLTYLYLTRATLALRLAAGACTGLTLLGIVGFLVASVSGMNLMTLALAWAFVASPLLSLTRADFRRAVRDDVLADWRERRGGFGVGACALIVALWFVFGFAVYERAGAIYTGFDNNLGDLPFHTSIVMSFAKGDNFPPEHTEFAGVRLTYPFLVDFVCGMFVSAGAGVASAFLIENVLLAFAFAGMVYLFAREVTNDPAAAGLSVALALLSGGLGWWMFLADAAAGGGLFAALGDLGRNYTIASTGGYRWGNAITVLLVPQRSLLLGTPLFLLACTLLWQAIRIGENDEREENGERESGTAARAGKRGKARKTAKHAPNSHRTYADDATARHADSSTAVPSRGALVCASVLPADRLAARRLLAAGVIAGLMPLAHAHAFAALVCVAGALAVLFRVRPGVRAWAGFFLAALLLAVPQLVWVTRGGHVEAGELVGWQFGWDRGTESFIPFLLKNTGLFIPLLFVALASLFDVWRGGRETTGDEMDASMTGAKMTDAGEPDAARAIRSSRVSGARLLFYVPFACLFVGANVLRLSPWIWDNIKVIYLWYVASVPFVAVYVVRLWESKRGATRIVSRVALACVVLTLTAAGALDVLRVVTGNAEQRIFDAEDVRFAGELERLVPAGARVLHAPVYNHPTFLAGRRSLIGYPGHLWTHGIDYLPREREVKAVYAGAPDAPVIVRRERIEYIVLGPHERSALKANEAALARHTLAFESGAYKLYRVAE